MKADGSVIKTITLTQDDAVDGYHWEKAVDDLPKYNADGSEIVYTMEEEVPEGYHVSYGIRKVKGLLVTFDDDTAVCNRGWTAYLRIQGIIGVACSTICRRPEMREITNGSMSPSAETPTTSRWRMTRDPIR